MSNTIDYYNANADQFIQGTSKVDISLIYTEFLKRIPMNGAILDFGCGSGRDTKTFLELGYVVDAIDGSEELCKLGSKHTGINVRCMLFQELNEIEKYDGIWACASILHLDRVQLHTVLNKMCDALKENGIIYVSFKYGTFEGERNGRYFTDFTEDAFAIFLAEIPTLKIEKQWITNDARPDRGEEKWLNIILRK